MIESVENLNKQAIDLATKGDFDMAIACLRRAIEMEKTNAFLWYNLGVTYRDSGETDKAFDAFLTARNYDPYDTEIIESLALLSFSKGDNLAAMNFCLEGIEIDEENSHLWNTLGVVNFNMGEYEDAALAFEQALCYSPFYYDALYNLRDTYEELHNRRGVLDCEERMKKLKKTGEGNYAG